MVTCSFKFQVITKDNEEINTHPNILVSLDNENTTMILKPNHPDSGYMKNLECLLRDSDFCLHLARSLYKEMSVALVPRNPNEAWPEDNDDESY